MTEAFATSFFNFVETVRPGSRLRLAPTPSGYLHAGNAVNFIFNWLSARAPEIVPAPKLFLRIDDLDADRKRPEYVKDVLETLDWLGLDWDGELVFQSKPSRLKHYESVLSDLKKHDLLFACAKSRRELAPYHGVYPTEFRKQKLPLRMPNVAWRIQYDPDDPGDHLTDFVVRRRDGIPSYQIASFADDLDMGITHIIRGADLEPSTKAQLFLARHLGADKFQDIHFLHHPLLRDERGEKLAKSAGAEALKSLRESGEGPESVFRTAGMMLGINGESAVALLAAIRRKSNV
jgi:glutamyl-tRNA synthetase